jgi:uncharacterized membrane protein (UPF0127 family)
MRTLALWMALLTLGLAACGGPGTAMKPEEYYTIPLRFPNGKTIRVEQLSDPRDIQRGMMFREELREDRGMLFYHGKPGYYSYWMYQVRIPLDIIWLDSRKRIVQVVHGAPPCPGPQEKCPVYGGGYEAQYVLEVRAGTAKANGLRPGVQLEF